MGMGSFMMVVYRFNPGRIDPTNSAWVSSRKPLVSAWETPSGNRFFTINVHLTAKLDGSSTQGNSRPPVNAGVDQRTDQVETVAVSDSTYRGTTTLNISVGLRAISSIAGSRRQYYPRW